MLRGPKRHSIITSWSRFIMFYLDPTWKIWKCSLSIHVTIYIHYMRIIHISIIQCYIYTFWLYTHTYIAIRIYVQVCMCIYIYTYIEGPPPRMHFSYADAAPKVGPGGSAVWAQANWQPNAFSTTELWGNQLQQIMFGKACGSKTGKGCRTPMRANSKETTLPETIAPQTRM